MDMPFFQNSMQGICEEASANDYDVMLVPVTGRHSGNLERMIANKKVDGVILSRSLVRDTNAVLLKEEKIPFVMMGTSRDAKILQVDNNHQAGCCALVSRMLNSGTVRIGLIGGSKNYVVNRTRKQGYEDAFQAVGIEPDAALCIEDCDSVEKVASATEKLVQLGVGAIVCMDDFVCSVALQVLAGKKFRYRSRFRLHRSMIVRC